MSWFPFAIICILGWGLADLYYKKSSDSSDRYSHLKIAVWVGITMGACSAVLFIFFGSWLHFQQFFQNAVRYLPASLSYIISMVIGYAGLRYLELSIISPLQNASGAFSMILILFLFIIKGNNPDIVSELTPLNIAGTAIIIVFGILLAVFEQKKSDISDKKHKFGALAFIFPLLYCIFDTLGTTFDGYILNEGSGMDLSETDVLILYGFTFFLFGVFAYIFLLIKEKKPYNPFGKNEKDKAIASLCEEFGQFFYVFAMAKNPVFAAPTVASYCAVSVLFSRLIIKEKLEKKQYICIFFVIAGIILMGISEGISSI